MERPTSHDVHIFDLTFFCCSLSRTLFSLIKAVAPCIERKGWEAASTSQLSTFEITCCSHFLPFFPFLSLVAPCCPWSVLYITTNQISNLQERVESQPFWSRWKSYTKKLDLKRPLVWPRRTGSTRWATILQQQPLTFLKGSHNPQQRDHCYWGEC